MMIIAAIIILSIISLLISSIQTTAVMAQTSPQGKQIRDDAWAYCEQITEELYPSACVAIAHESPTLVVLGGKLLLNPFVGASTPIDNIIIWQAVDGFKGLGYDIDSVLLTGQGTESNPHNIMVVMSK